MAHPPEVNISCFLEKKKSQSQGLIQLRSAAQNAAPMRMHTVFTVSCKAFSRGPAGTEGRKPWRGLDLLAVLVCPRHKAHVGDPLQAGVAGEAVAGKASLVVGGGVNWLDLEYFPGRKLGLKENKGRPEKQKLTPRHQKSGSGNKGYSVKSLAAPRQTRI